MGSQLPISNPTLLCWLSSGGSNGMGLMTMLGLFSGIKGTVEVVISFVSGPGSASLALHQIEHVFSFALKNQKYACYAY
jgi:hypothetical protein